MADGDPGATDPLSGFGGGNSDSSDQQKEQFTPIPQTNEDFAPKAEAAEHTQQQYSGSKSEADMLTDMEAKRKQAEQENQQYNATVAPMYKKVLEMENTPRDYGLTMPQPTQDTTNPNQIWQQNRHDLQKSTLGYLAVAVPLAIAMGSRGGPAMAGAWGGLGKGLSALVKGYDDQAETALSIWQHQGNQGSKKFTQQMQAYKQTLADRGYNLKQMEDMIRTTAKFYGDKRLADAKDWNEMRQELALKERIKNDYEKKLHETTRDVYHKTGKSDVYKAWAANMQDHYGVDVYQEWGNLSAKDQEAIREHPFDTWLDEHKGKGKAKKEEEPKKEEEKKPDDKKVDSWNKHLLD